MIAAPHLEDEQGLVHGAFNLDVAEQNVAVDHEGEGIVRRLGVAQECEALPGEDGGQPFAFEAIDEPVRGAAQLGWLFPQPFEVR